MTARRIEIERKLQLRAVFPVLREVTRLCDQHWTALRLLLGSKCARSQISEALEKLGVGPARPVSCRSRGCDESDWYFDQMSVSVVTGPGTQPICLIYVRPGFRFAKERYREFEVFLF